MGKSIFLAYVFFFFLVVHKFLSIFRAYLSVHLPKIIFTNLFYYLTYLYYYSWVPLYFLILFMGSIILFQLTFYLYLLYFQQKNFSFNKISRSQMDTKKVMDWEYLFFSQTKLKWWKVHFSLLKNFDMVLRSFVY